MHHFLWEDCLACRVMHDLRIWHSTHLWSMFSCPSSMCGLIWLDHRQENEHPTPSGSNKGFADNFCASPTVSIRNKHLKVSYPVGSCNLDTGEASPLKKWFQTVLGIVLWFSSNTMVYPGCIPPIHPTPAQKTAVNFQLQYK